MTPGTIHCFQHVPFEGPALIRHWAEGRGFTMECTPLYRGARIPDLLSSRMLVVMGGPMGVHDTGRYPWMLEEKKSIESALKAGIRVLGVCLGAQLVADVLGSRVYAGTVKEIGWYPVERTEEAMGVPLGRALPPSLDVFHWHGDTFDLPKGSIRLARSRAYEQQAFLYDNLALGLQFHMEMELRHVEAIVENCREELTNGPYIQTETDILELSKQAGTAGTVLYKLLDLFLN